MSASLPSEEQPDPRDVVRPEPFPSGGKQDDEQSPFTLSPEEPVQTKPTGQTLVSSTRPQT